MAIMVDRLDQVLPLKARARAPARRGRRDAKPFEQVVTIFDLLPRDQAEKIPLLDEMRDHAHAARARGIDRRRRLGRALDATSPPPHLGRSASTICPSSSRGLHREGRHARAHRLHRAQRRAQRLGRALPRAAGPTAFRTIELPERRGHPWLGPRGHLRRHDAGDRRGRAQGHRRSFVGTCSSCSRVPRSPRARGACSLRCCSACVAGRVPVRSKRIKLNFLNFVALPDHLRHRRRLRGQRHAARTRARGPRACVTSCARPAARSCSAR